MTSVAAPRDDAAPAAAAGAAGHEQGCGGLLPPVDGVPGDEISVEAGSYTHLTLPTNSLVERAGGRRVLLKLR